MAMVLKQQLKKRMGKKGFTLIEVIVVLVILAILAAIAIPALTGYINKANTRAITSEGRTVAVALQAVTTDAYGQNVALNGTVFTTTSSGVLVSPYDAEFKNLSDIPAASVSAITVDGTKITKFKYTKSDGKSVTFENGKYTAS